MTVADKEFHNADGPLGHAMAWASVVLVLSADQSRDMRPIFAEVHRRNALGEKPIVMAQLWDATNGNDYACVRLLVGDEAERVAAATKRTPATLNVMDPRPSLQPGGTRDEADAPESTPMGAFGPNDATRPADPSQTKPEGSEAEAFRAFGVALGKTGHFNPDHGGATSKRKGLHDGARRRGRTR